MVDKVSFTMTLKALAITAGITKNVSGHTFRHSFATHMLEAGADLMAIRDMLGHASVTTTEYYLQLSKDHLRQTLQDYHPSWQNEIDKEG